MNFSETLSRAMEKLGLKRSDVAKASGYSHQYISDLLSGDRRWNEDSINRVCGALGITLEVKCEDNESTDGGEQ